MSYNADDIWGLFGDCFDQIGLPNCGFVLEGGSWQSKKVIGATIPASPEDRVIGRVSEE